MLTWWMWILIGLAAWIVVDLLLLLFGVTGVLVWLTVAFYHGFFKLEPPPGINDDNWSRDQGKEAK
jgi:hypothetical protein